MADANAKNKQGKPPPVVVKKVSPYPFVAQVDQAGQKKNIEVIKLTSEGIIARMDKVLVNVGEHYQLQFELPVVRYLIVVQALVMKTYDKSVNPKIHVIDRMAEFRFEGLTDQFRNNIATFLGAIGQQN